MLDYLGSRRPAVTHRCATNSSIGANQRSSPRQSVPTEQQVARACWPRRVDLNKWLQCVSFGNETVVNDSVRSPHVLVAHYCKASLWSGCGRCIRSTVPLMRVICKQCSRGTRRDVKPENIVLEDSQPGGRVYLVDFGGVQASQLLASVCVHEHRSV